MRFGPNLSSRTDPARLEEAKLLNDWWNTGLLHRSSIFLCALFLHELYQLEMFCGSHVFCYQTLKNHCVHEVFGISRIINVEVGVISRSRRLRLITLTETLITLDITNHAYVTSCSGLLVLAALFARALFLGCTMLCNSGSLYLK